MTDMVVDDAPSGRWEDSAAFRAHPLAEVIKVSRAPHMESPEAGNEEIVAHCGAAFTTPPDLHYLAHFGTGFFDFSIDAFEHAACRSRYGSRTPADLRIDHQAGCKHLMICAERLDRSLAELKTGELMRVVVVAEDGALACCRVRPGQYIVGTTLHGGTAYAADMLVSTTVSKIRRDVYGLPDELPGGIWNVELPPVVPGVMVNRKGEVMSEALHRNFTDLCGEALNRDDLHLVMLLRDWTFAASVDILDNPYLGQWFNNISRETRRKLYERLGTDLRQELAQVAHAVRTVLVKPIERLILDVQEGAIYIYRLGREGDFLIGATLRQPAVYQAEKRLRTLIDTLRADNRFVRDAE